MKNMVRNFFMDLYFELEPSSACEIAIRGKFFGLSQEEVIKLTKPLEGIKVKQAFFNMRPFKAPGPDGFQAGFCRNLWSITTHSFLQ